jgi:hypothetical protein
MVAETTEKHHQGWTNNQISIKMPKRGSVELAHRSIDGPRYYGTFFIASPG